VLDLKEFRCRLGIYSKITVDISDLVVSLAPQEILPALNFSRYIRFSSREREHAQPPQDHNITAPQNRRVSD
jgi:hypothetical protein